MKQPLAVLVLCALAFLAGRYSGSTPPRVHAQSQQRSRVWAAPKSWGQFKAVYYDQLLFEDDEGTIRSVYPNSTAVVFMIQRR
jgi:hypothetical protein